MSPRFALVAVVLASSLASSSASAQIRAYDESFTDEQFAVLIDVDPITAIGSVPLEYSECDPPVIAPPNIICNIPDCTSVAAYIGGLAYVGPTLYGVEWTSGSAGSDVFLSRIDVGPTGCATATRLDPNTPLGFVNVDNLAYVPADGVLYAVDFGSASPNLGQLIQIDTNTSVANTVGSPLPPEVYVVGLTYDPLDDLLYALTLGSDTRGPELLTLDRSTGQIVEVIGGIGRPNEENQSLALGSFLTAGTQLRELDPNTGEASIPIGGGGNYNGTLWAMARIPDDPCAGAGGDSDGDGLCNDEDNCPFVWNVDQEDCCTPGSTSTSNPDGIGDACQCGDVTGDGQVNGIDATMIVRQELGLLAPLFRVPRNCDVTGDGACTGIDATMITRRSLNLFAPIFGNNCPNFTGGP